MRNVLAIILVATCCLILAFTTSGCKDNDRKKDKAPPPVGPAPK